MDNTLHYHGHRKRLRKRFIKCSEDGFYDYELLELLLTYSIPRRDVKPIAKRLVEKFGNVSGVFGANFNELREIEGISENSAALIILVRDLGVKYLEERMLNSDALSSPSSVANFAKMKLSAMQDEVLIAIFVNAKNHVTNYEIISEGTVDAAVVYPRKIVRKALEKNASGIILVHNHPSGECSPSQDDIGLTLKVKEAAAPMDIRVLDHLIVGKSGYFSFLEKNIMP